MKIKEGVDIAGIRPEMVIAAMVCESIYNKYDLDPVITSCKDGKHMRGSLHYSGMALDYRTRDIPTDGLKNTIAREIATALGSQFDVVIHDLNFHIEFQPKV